MELPVGIFFFAGIGMELGIDPVELWLWCLIRVIEGSLVGVILNLALPLRRVIFLNINIVCLLPGAIGGIFVRAREKIVGLLAQVCRIQKIIFEHCCWVSFEGLGCGAPKAFQLKN